MKAITIFLLACAVVAQAQTPIQHTQPVEPGQKIVMHFDYPELIRVTTWDQPVVSVEGTVSINGGDQDDAFKLKVNSSPTAISISGTIPNLKKLPHRITINRDGQKVTFKTQADYRSYANQYGTAFTSMREGVETDIILTIKVPKNVATRIEARYGLVEVRDFDGPLVVDAIYGGIDVALVESTTGKLVAETNYGQIYSNLNLKLDKENLKEENFHTVIAASLGTGPAYNLESKFGNVYLRKQVK